MGLLFAAMLASLFILGWLFCTWQVGGGGGGENPAKNDLSLGEEDDDEDRRGQPPPPGPADHVFLLRTFLYERSWTYIFIINNLYA
jgi:hypothetical protein